MSAEHIVIMIVITCWRRRRLQRWRFCLGATERNSMQFFAVRVYNWSQGDSADEMKDEQNVPLFIFSIVVASSHWYLCLFPL
jgi:hypothetical protein